MKNQQTELEAVVLTWTLVKDIAFLLAAALAAKRHIVNALRALQNKTRCPYLNEGQPLDHLITELPAMTPLITTM
jgi:hypothetical protein